MTIESHLYKVRRADRADASRLARCRLEMFREIRGDPAPALATSFETLCEQTMARFAADGSAICWLAEVPGRAEPIGSVTLLVFPRLPTFESTATREGYLGTVY